MTNPIKPNGEYDQAAAEKPNTEEPKRSGVQINIDESNAANEKLEAQMLPHTFDKTEAGQRAHAKKFGGEKGSQRDDEPITTEDTSTLNPERQGKGRNFKR
jgi:hypothetical protein